MLAKTLHRWGWSLVCRRSVSLMFHEHGPPERVLGLHAEEKRASPGPHECALRMLAVPINPVDVNTIQGTYGTKPSLPCIPGSEGVFEVVEVGTNVTKIKPGDRVIRVTAKNTGTWQTNPVFPEDDLHTVPHDVPNLMATTLVANPPTAYIMLKEFVQLQEGDVVIQNGANSGVGQAVIQIASVRKLKTINIVRDRPNLTELVDRLKSMGATEVVTEEFARSYKINSIIEKLGKPRLALNGVGGKSSLNLLHLIADGGTMVTYGGMSRQLVTVPTGTLIFNSVNVCGFSLVTWTKENFATSGEKLYDDVIGLAQSGHLKPVVQVAWKMEDFKMAIAQAMKPHQTRKQVFVN